ARGGTLSYGAVAFERQHGDPGAGGAKDWLPPGARAGDALTVSRTRLSGRHAGGFSLLEAIVTLVIVAMVVTVLMQALAQSLDMREWLLRHQRQSRTAALQEQWFRNTVSSAASDLPGALGRMAGGPGRIELLTPVPLVGTGLA